MTIHIIGLKGTELHTTFFSMKAKFYFASLSCKNIIIINGINSCKSIKSKATYGGCADVHPLVFALSLSILSYEIIECCQKAAGSHDVDTTYKYIRSSIPGSSASLMYVSDHCFTDL